MKKNYAYLIILLLVLIPSAQGYQAQDYRGKANDELRLIFDGWSKIHPDIKMTFDEWRAVAKNGMLPEQVQGRKIGGSNNQQDSLHGLLDTSSRIPNAAGVVLLVILLTGLLLGIVIFGIKLTRR